MLKKQLIQQLKNTQHKEIWFNKNTIKIKKLLNKFNQH